MSESPILDHMVINVQFQMDEAEAAFERLGFTNTPRGYHSLGSINHLMILGTDYLELIGLPAGEPPRRAELVNAPPGFNGLVFKTEDVAATYEHLCALDMDGDPRPAADAEADLRDSTLVAMGASPLEAPGPGRAGFRPVGRGEPARTHSASRRSISATMASPSNSWHR